ncbi:MAG: CBS domain-containing protein [Deltaproteobacteria bacterium]|nr:CBS domain-containing protein [Deltaproteobacteria bacterium]MBW2048062.1 CBS domain-containing protein [Deltaproteobacteria bacterium]HDZ90100.1 CBS domain-containing protein [Deltaproteobacteria bacterium]
MPVKDLLEEHGRYAAKLDGTCSLEDAIKLMTDRDISALIVMEENRPVGIFTERDVLLSHVRFDQKPFSEIKLKNAMTRRMIVARPGDEIDNTICLMIQSGIRHIPVVEKGEIISILNICDLAHHQVGDLATELHYLEEYLSELHEAGRD